MSPVSHHQPPQGAPHPGGPPVSATGPPQEHIRGPGIVTPHDHDVLCGRGGATNNHVGNTNYRKLVSHNKRLYITCPKRHKIIVSRSIVEAVRRQNPPGRFLNKEADGLWYDIGHQKALEKTSQALREGAQEIRNQMEAESKESNNSSSGKSENHRPEMVTSSKRPQEVDLSKTESEDSHAMPPPPVRPARRSSIKKDGPLDDVSMSSRSRKDRVKWDQDSINTTKSKSNNRNDGLTDSERSVVNRLERVSGGRSSRVSSTYSSAKENSSAYEPTPLRSGNDELPDGLESVPSITFSDIGISLGSFGMTSHRSGMNGNDMMSLNDDDVSIQINEAVFGSSRSIGMNSVPSLGSVSKDWSKAKSAMSYDVDEMSQMMAESIKSFQSMGIDKNFEKSYDL